MKIAICDDEIPQINIIKSAAEEYLGAVKNNDVKIDTFDNAFHFLDAQEKACYDLALLDICMPGILGTDAAREIRQRQDKTEIIFLTSSSDYAVDAFSLRAAHYLIKPFTKPSFYEAMNRAMQTIRQNLSKKITLKRPGGAVEIVEKDTVCYIESASHRQNVFLTEGKTVEAVQTLAELFTMLQELAKGQFILPYKGFLVNQCQIRNIESDRIILKNGKEIPIQRRSFRQIKQAYFDFMFGGDK